MSANRRRSVALLVGLTLLVAVRVVGQSPAADQGQAPVNPTAPGTPAGRGRGLTSFPAQQRPPDDPAVVERGKRIYGISCRACHGADLRGGDIGGPNLLRSDVMLNDRNGELLLPVVRGSRADSGMSAIDLPEDEVTAVAVYIHSVLATSRAQGAPPSGPPVELNILVGNAAAGEAYLNTTCSGCHSATGDLQGIATRVSNATQLQNRWVGGGRGGAAGRGEAPDDPPTRRTVTVAITLATGQKVEGKLDRIDDFYVSLFLADGSRRTFRRVGPAGEVPKVEINDPLAAHRALLEKYTDRDMHNVTAYLVTLK